MSNIIEIKGLSKQYRLGQLGTGTISHDLNRMWHRLLKKEDPYLKVTAKNERASKEKNDYVWALEDINFSLKKGEVLGIIGKNGAGKSTLLKILSRITSPTTGSIKIKGRISSLLEVGTGFHPELTGKENIYLNGTILGMTRAEISAKIDEIIEFSGCAKYIDTPVKRYSSGMTVRLGFAVAAYLESEILVVDEVLAVGDLAFQKKCIGKMKDISQSGRSILFVSHNLNSVANLCDTGILIEDGKITHQGEISDVIEKYLDSDLIDNNPSIDLSFFKDRVGTGEMKFTSIDIYTKSKLNNTIKIGDDLTLKVNIKSIVKMNSTIAIHIYNYEQEIISNIENTDSQVMIPAFVGSKTFEISIANMRLYPGKYKIGLWIGDNVSSQHIDLLRYCAEFTIAESSPIVFRNLPTTTGKFYLNPTWKIN